MKRNCILLIVSSLTWPIDLLTRLTHCRVRYILLRNRFKPMVKQYGDSWPL